MNREEYLKRALDQLQFLDEIGGPERDDYIWIMLALAEECKTRACNAAEAA